MIQTWRIVVAISLLVLTVKLVPVGANDDANNGDAFASGSGEEDDAKSPNNGQEFNSKGTSKITLADIIQLTVNAIVGTTQPEFKKEILLKHFFSDKKAQSIWAKIIKANEKKTGREFEERELADMENAVKNIYSRMLECDLNNMGKKKADNMKNLVTCYFTLNAYIQDGFVDFSYPRQNSEEQSHVFEMNVAYNIMCLLILRITKSLADTAKMETFNTEMSIYKIAEALVNSAVILEENSIEVRMQAISQIEICQMQEVLWQEFTGYCETRSKRDVAGIGGSSAIFEQIYRAKVTDKIRNKRVCNMREKSAPGQDVDIVKKGLTKSCQKKRKIYADKLRKKITKYYKRISAPIIDDLPKLWGNDETKLQNLKKELETKLSRSEEND